MPFLIWCCSSVCGSATKRSMHAIRKINLVLCCMCGNRYTFLKKNNGFQKWKRYFEKSYEEVVSYTRYFPLCNLSSYLNIIINIIIPHNTRSYTYSVKKSWNILCSCLSRLQYVQKWSLVILKSLTFMSKYLSKWTFIYPISKS